MTKKTSRPRTARRVAAQANRRAVERIERLATRLPGGAPDQPLRVTSASVIEVRARSSRCLTCDGELDLRAHVADEGAPDDLRRVELACRRCGRPRQQWFRIEPPLGN